MAKFGKCCFVVLTVCAVWWLTTLVIATLANSLVDPPPCFIRAAPPWPTCAWFTQGTNHLLNAPFVLLTMPFEAWRRHGLAALGNYEFYVVAIPHLAALLYAADRLRRRVKKVDAVS